MPLLTLRQITYHYGQQQLLEGVNLTLEPLERVALVGHNGSGKSTLLKIIDSELTPDSGQIEAGQHCRITSLPQDVHQDLDGTVYEVIASGEKELANHLLEYHRLTAEMETNNNPSLWNRFEKVQHALDTGDGWQLSQRIDEVISKLKLNADTDFKKLSGGMKRRVLLGRALVKKPDLILLDEPTNHLDIESINWLESFFTKWGGTVLFITHDRHFLQQLATRIIDLDRGTLTSYPGNYLHYCDLKEQQLENESTQNALFDKKLAEEEKWIRQGVKARRTRNEGRVRALEKMRQQRQQRRNRIGSVDMQVDSGELSGKLVIEAKNLQLSYGARNLIRDFSTTIVRGDRIGLIGPNGVGKTTLIRLLLQDIEPDSGSIRQGTNLQVAYFDQHRHQLDNEATVFDAVAEGHSEIDVGGRKRHVMSYLGDFLFAPDRARVQVKALSGGERNRLLLARLFTKPSNVLVLDEPTNDLDIETLELLEELLLDYKGTLLLVSHDREFINNVVTSTMVFNGTGVIEEYVGGYEDWLRQRPEPSQEISEDVKSDKLTAPASSNKEPQESGKKKLSYKLQRELESLPKQIETLEGEIGAITQLLADNDFYSQPKDVIAAKQQELTQLQQSLEVCFQRWEELEDLRN